MLTDGLFAGLPFTLHHLDEGEDAAGRLAAICGERGQILIVTSPGMARRDSFRKLIDLIQARVTTLTIGSNPDLDGVGELLTQARRINPDMIVGLGGGSAMDTAKVLAVLLHPENQALTLAGVLREGRRFAAHRIALACIPTTSGTGAEATPFATVWDNKLVKKRSFASPCLVPDAVLLDPVLTATAPLELTIDCALDACSHAMESLWNKHATHLSVRYASHALERFNQALPALMQDLTDLPARRCMQEASFSAGLAIAITKTAIAHSISYPITLHHGVPHGLACSFTLPKIAQAVNQADAWVAGVPRPTIQETLQVVSSVRLEERINAYCSRDQRLALIEEMFTPGRGDNFVLADLAVQDVL